MAMEREKGELENFCHCNTATTANCLAFMQRKCAMCGIEFDGICRLTELTSTQLGFTKQLVFRVALPHITLLLVATGYLIVGGWALSTLRYADETSMNDFNELNRLKQTLLADLTQNRYSETLARRELTSILVNYTVEVLKVQNKHANQMLIKLTKAKVLHEDDDRSTKVIWNVFFAATALTSIGYGNIAPNSLLVRLFVIVYVFFGIPLFLITMADLAKFCAEFINWCYAQVLKCKFYAHQRLKKWIDGEESDSEKISSKITIAGGEDEIAEFLWAHLENAHFVEVPFLLVYMLLIVYVFVASYLVSKIEGWSIYEAIYFVVISVLTIGFGDFVPRNQPCIPLMLLILLFGVVLATTCIDIAGAYYIDRLHFFGRNPDTQDPLVWLKSVKQRRVECMKREAMRRLFETLTALHHMQLGIDVRLHLDKPDPPRNLRAFNATANSVMLKWSSPSHLDEGGRFWYTIKYRIRNQEHNNSLKVIDFVNTECYVVTGLRSFTLYTFSVRTTTRFGTSTPVQVQEYTEPCTVPQSLTLISVSQDSATFTWKAPQRNIGQEKYLIQYSEEPAPKFGLWNRCGCGSAKKFTIINLTPDTRFIMCVSAEHNYGLAAMSKSLRFKTREALPYSDQLSYSRIDDLFSR